MKAMSQILVAISSDSVFGMFEPLVRRSDLLLTRVRSGHHALTLAREVPCDLILCQHPLVDIQFQEFHAQLRSRRSSSAHSPLLVMAREDRKDVLLETAETESEELFRVVDLEVDSVKEALVDLVGVATRSDSRLLVETRVNCDHRTSNQVFQTANISESGFLLRSRKPLPVGLRTSFALTLPDSEQPISGTVEVVRHTDSQSEIFEGMAVRLLEVEDDGRQRLAKFIERRLAEP